MTASAVAAPDHSAGAAGRIPGPSWAERRERFARRLGRWLRKNAMSFYVAMFFLVLGMIMLAPKIFITIPAGHVGVMWYRFLGGTDIDATYDEGMHVIFPWDEMYVYDARLQNTARIYDTISSNGLSMQVEIAVRYRINTKTVGLLHKLVGPGYAEVLVYPEIGSHARELISRYTPEQLYTETRAFIQAEILHRMVNQLGSSLANQSFGGKLVEVEDVLLRSIRLPPTVASAIERKAEQYQMMLEYDFRLARERKERERKRIEAEGVREYQDIVARTITDEYLRLRGIEATLALATSPNSKTVIVGGKDGLPLILNTEGAASGALSGLSPAAGTGSTAALSRNPQNARQEEVPAANALGDSVIPGVPLPPGPVRPPYDMPAETPRILFPGPARSEGSGAFPPDAAAPDRVRNEADDTPAKPDAMGARPDRPTGGDPFGQAAAPGARR